MKGLFVIAKQQLAVLELPEPVIGEYEALVQVEACGICNSTDHKLIEGEFFSGSYPILLGHESVGRVTAVGTRVRSFQIGDRVLRSTLRDVHLPFPGGRSLWGGYVEKAIVRDVWAEQGTAYNAFPHPQQIVPSGIPPAEAVMLITLKETLSCLENTSVLPGQSLAIVGSGPVAQGLTVMAKLKGIAPVVVFGRNPAWAELFLRLGADAYATGDDQPLMAQKILAQGGFDRVIEAVGAREALSTCREIASGQGRINIYGVAPESEGYLAEDEADERVFHGAVTEAEAHQQMLAWVSSGKIRLADWVGAVLPWQEYERGFTMVANKELSRQGKVNKVVLSFP